MTTANHDRRLPRPMTSTIRPAAISSAIVVIISHSERTRAPATPPPTPPQPRYMEKFGDMYVAVGVGSGWGLGGGA